MNREVRSVLSQKIAKKFDRDVSRSSLEAMPGCPKLFDAFIYHVGLKDKTKDDIKSKKIGAVTNTRDKSKDHYYLDYYFQKFSGLTTKQPNFSKLVSDILSFDKKLTHRNWRRIGAVGRDCSERTAEIFFCCSAAAHGRSLIAHLAEFFKNCQNTGLKLDCLESHKDTIDSLISQDFTAYDLSSGKKSLGFEIKWKNHACEIRECFSENNLHIPEYQQNQDYDNVASLLDWQYQLTEFVGRTEELKRLRNWLDFAADRKILVIHGDAGVGKSRLAFHFAQEALDYDWETGQAGKSLSGNWMSGKQGMLLIIDYPEEKGNLVKELLRAVMDMPPSKKKLRILLLSRNLECLEKLTIDVRGLLSQPIHLVGLEKSHYKLLSLAWDKLQLLKPDSKISDHALPIVENNLQDWLNVDPMHKTPLILLALAIYLSDEANPKGVSLLLLSASEIIRHLSIREERRIRNEITDAHYKPRSDKKVEVESFLLLKAMAAITNGFDEELLHSTINDINQRNIYYPLPDIERLKDSSLWINEELPPIKPDLVAADFLAYSLQRYAREQEAEWIYPTLGFNLTKNSNICRHKPEYFIRFGRLIFDFKVRLKIAANSDWPANTLLTPIRNCSYIMEWFTHELVKENFGDHLLPLLKCAYTEAINDTYYTEPHRKLFREQLTRRLLNAGEFDESKVLSGEVSFPVSDGLASNEPDYARLSSAEEYIKKSNAATDKKKSIQLMQSAISIYKELYEETPDNYARRYASKLHNFACLYADYGDIENGLVEIHKALKIKRKLSEEDFFIHCKSLANSLDLYAGFLFEAKDINAASKAIQEALDIYEMLARDSPAKHEKALERVKRKALLIADGLDGTE